MKKTNYANIVKDLLGNELYCKFLKEIAKENEGMNLIEFSEKIMEQCYFVIMAIGMSKKIKLDKVKLCVEDEMVEVSCKEFAEKYERYLNDIIYYLEN